VVASPQPKRIFEIRPIDLLVRSGVIVICAGGGGIPTMYVPDDDPRAAPTPPHWHDPAEGGPVRDRTLVGVEAVIDKDRAGSLLARSLRADAFLMLTDADAVYLDWGTPAQRAVRQASPDALERYTFASGSMGPKVEAACEFARATDGFAAIGALADATALLRRAAGTIVSRDVEGLDLHD
jgi:carbamate kinase